MAKPALLQCTLLPGAAPLQTGREAVAQALAAAGVPAEQAARVDLVLEELLGNALRHGLAGHAAPSLQLALWLTADEVRLALRDNAPCFDPVQQPERPRPANLAEATPGGLGLPLVRRMVRAWDHRFTEGHNTLNFSLNRLEQRRSPARC